MKPTNTFAKLFSSISTLAVVAGAMALNSGSAIAGDPGVVVNSEGNDIGRGKCIKVEYGYSHSAVIQENGQVVAWGFNERGACNVPSDLGPCKAIAIGAYLTSGFTVALKIDGTVVAWGNNDAGQCNFPPSLGPCIQIAAGWLNTLVLKSNGTVASFGNGEQGQGNVPSIPCLQIAAGNYHGLAISENGTVYQWGNCYSPPSDLGPCKAIAGGLSFSVAIKNDGTVVQWGLNYNGQLSVPASIGRCKSISAGDYGVAAIRENGVPVSFDGSGFRIYEALGPCTEINAGYGSDFLAIQAPPSSITGVLPISGPTTGGTTITISGTKFQNPPIVKIGGVLATDVVWVSSNTVRAVTPIGTPGMTTVSVNEISVEGFYYRPTCGSDLDNNGVVDSADLGIVLLDFGNCSESLTTPQPEPLIFQSIEIPTPLLLNKK